MIRPCTDSDVPNIFAIVNDAAQAYKGVIPADRWHEPYMPLEELKEEIAAGVKFWGYEDGSQLIGVMGMQPVKEVTLIRHAYVKTEMRNRGIGGKLLAHLLGQIGRENSRRDLEGRRLGRQVLPEARIPTGQRRREEPVAQNLLEHSRAAD